jgi:predicted nucleic acid-binding protein
MSGRRILIDTSVWIEYFRNKSDALSKQVDAILSYDEVVVPKVVIAELVQGARSEKEISVVEGFVGAFNVVDHKYFDSRPTFQGYQGHGWNQVARFPW